MTARHVKVGEYTEEQLRVQRAGEALHRDGASPAGALELLAAIVEDRTWERVTDKAGRSFKGRFREFVNDRTAGLGYDPDQLPKVLALQHPHESVPDVAYRMATMREEVVTLLLTEISRAAPHGGDRRSEEFQDVGHNLKGRRTSAESARTVGRLKRDDPELAERVVNGEVTPYQAQRDKGWKPPRIYLTSPERVAASLLRYMSADDIAELIAALLGKGHAKDLSD